MPYLYITYKDYENSPRPHLGMSWRSGRYKRVFSVLERSAARAQMSKIESQGRRWGRVAVVNRSEEPMPEERS